MASNFWALYMTAYKMRLAIPILYERYTTKTKTKQLTFVITEYSYYKKLSLIATSLFLLPLVKKMWTNIKIENFCKYLALVNLISYNFGYHVHEKAILMTYIPLLIDIKTHLDIHRVKLIGFVMLLTFMPLIPGEFEAVIKNGLLSLHYLMFDVLLKPTLGTT